MVSFKILHLTYIWFQQVTVGGSIRAGGGGSFINETIRLKCCDDANRNRNLHVLVWSNMSAVWTYFSISEKDPRTAICKTCNAEISRGGASANTFSTSGLIYHLKSKHSDRYAEYERNAAQKRKTPPSTPTPSVADVFEKARKFPSDGVKAKGITQKIMEFIPLDDQPFSVVEDVGFRRLIEHIEPRYVMPSRQHFSGVFNGAV